MVRSKALNPVPLDELKRRIIGEWTARRTIFDLPSARYFRADDRVDLTAAFQGRECATPVGLAAGPHTQLAQNIALGWLGGARIFELKTVQIDDDITVARPCIDAATLSRNIEWSQELTIAESLAEYHKAAELVHFLGEWDPIAELVGRPGDSVFDISVGYDFEGVRHTRMATFLDSMRDIASSVTLSTFHGCPAEEIDAICRHLMDRHGFDVAVKINPTMLGFDRVTHIINDELDYDLAIERTTFASDPDLDRGVELIEGLAQHAVNTGRRFGIKATNTLLIGNSGELPGDSAYLAGPPLHVVGRMLVEELEKRLPGRLGAVTGADIGLSFAGGVGADNIATTLASAVESVTICSDLLRPGGYGRLEPMLRTLESAVLDSGGDTFGDLQRVSPVQDADLYKAYRASTLPNAPRSVDSDLSMFDCVDCNLCVTVCPNDAFFAVPNNADSTATDARGHRPRSQYMLFAELCNDCGNCTTFCPERGDPFVEKPRLYRSADWFEESEGLRFLISGNPGEGFAIERSDGADEVLERMHALLQPEDTRVEDEVL